MKWLPLLGLLACTSIAFGSVALVPIRFPLFFPLGRG